MATVGWKINFSLNYMRVGSIETFLALLDDLHCGFPASNLSDFNISMISQLPEECRGR